MKIKLKDLKRIIREAKDGFVTENVATDLKKPEPRGEDSLDAQVDRYLAEYESEAKSSKTEGIDWRRTVKRFLFEKDDDASTDDTDATDVDLSGTDDKSAPPEAPAKLSTEDIDMSSYANSVVRLIDNYDSLLEVRNTVLRRAVKFLEKNYDADVVKQFEEHLRDEHDLEMGMSKLDVADEEYPAPAAARAGGPGEPVG